MALSCHERVPYPRFKLIIVGDAGTGKTSFLKRHLNGESDMQADPTIGVEVRPMNFVTNYGYIMMYGWDTIEQEDELLNDYRNQDMNQFYKYANCAIIMFDVSAPETYHHVPIWYKNIRRLSKAIPIVLCGNKVDIKDRKVKAADITFHKENGLPYFEVSAKSNYNFQKPFLYLAGQLLRDSSIYFARAPRLAPPDVEIDLKAQQENEQELA